MITKTQNIIIMENLSLEIKWFLAVYFIISFIVFCKWWMMTNDVEKIKRLLEDKLKEDKKEDNEDEK